MEKRKIQEVGGGTYTVSLPLEWAKSEGLTQGTAVNLHTHLDGILVIQPQESENDPAARVEIRVDRPTPESLEQTLRAAYATGAKEVVPHGPELFRTDQHRAVDNVARNLAGTSVVEESESKITVRILLDASEVSVVQSVRQLAFVALSMHREATAALTDGAQSGGFDERDDQADRLYALIERSFSRALARLDEVDALGLTRPELFDLWSTTRELERVADHAEGIATLATDEAPLAESAVDAVQDRASRARSIVEGGVGVVVGDAGVETAREALAVRDGVCDDITADDRFPTASSGVDERPGLVTFVMKDLHRTARHGGNIAELGLRSAIRRDELPSPSPLPETERSVRDAGAQGAGGESVRRDDDDNDAIDDAGYDGASDDAGAGDGAGGSDGDSHIFTHTGR